MKRLISYIFFFCFLAGGDVLFAQSLEDTLVMRFMDVEIPLSNVSVFSRNGIFITQSDSAGYARVPALYLRYSYLIAMRDGYVPDTIRKYSENVFLDPLSAVLEEAVVSSKTMQRVLQSGMEYVVDYDFVGDNILVAAYNGASGRNAKLFLLNNYGDTLAFKKLPEEPLAIYKSCIGQYYCVCFRRFYPIYIDSGKIELGMPYDIRYLSALQECQIAIGDNLYYKISSPDQFDVTYAYLAQGDTNFHVFLHFHDSLAYRNSREEDASYYTAEERRTFMHKFDVGYMRSIWDKGNFRLIDAPLFTKDDSILLFDYTQMQIRYFNRIGAEVKKAPFYFAKSTSQSSEIIKDELTDRFYLHAASKTAVQTVNEIALQSGVIDNHRVKMERPFAENIKIHNGNIYFLWQDARHSGTRQLYVQKAF